MSNQRRSNLNCARGSALVELAIQLPVYAMIFALFFDTMISYVAKGHSELASMSLLFNFKATPQVVDTDPSSGNLTIRELNQAERAGFLSNLHSTLVYSLQNAGSFADPNANVAIRMYSLNINPRTGFFSDSLPRETLLNEFYVGETATSSNLDCFGDTTESQKYSEQLKLFAQETFNKLEANEVAEVPLGKPVPVFSTGQVNSDPYMNKRTLILYLTCYRPSISFFNSEPRISKFVLLPGKEVSWKNN